MSPDRTIQSIRDELKALETYCTSQIGLVQRQLTEERKACIRRYEEIKALIAKLVLDDIEHKRLDVKYRKESTALGEKHTKILHKILERVGCRIDGE
jgi:hypothetical protein